MRQRPKLHKKLTYANVIATLALFLALGGGAIAASNLGKNSVGPKRLKKNSVTTAKIQKEAVTAAKVKKGTLTGTQINSSTLGTVPNAQTAQTANAIAAAEPWHEVGAPGEPGFLNNWKNTGTPYPGVAFYKDREGIVHLRGAASSGTSPSVFSLPPGYRPGTGSILAFPVVCGGGGPCEASGVARAAVVGPGVSPALDGVIQAPGGANFLNFDGITFRPES